MLGDCCMAIKINANKYTEKEIFETLSVPKAVAALALPTIISQLVTMIYNMADTFFVGQIGNYHMTAAVSLVYPAYTLLGALANLFGIGGGSLISRMLGGGRDDEVKNVSSFSLYGSIIVTVLYSVFCLIFMEPFMRFLGASDDTIGFASNYTFWIIVIGGLPTVLGLMLAHLLRSEGHAAQASFGMMLGGILNVILDPIFIFIFDMNVIGAAVATTLSNCISMLYFLWEFSRLKGQTAMSLHPRFFGWRYIIDVFSVGLPSAIGTTLACVSNMMIVKLASGYGDVPVAAFGIVKKLDMFPLNICMGLCQGFMPLVGYNFAAKNYKRMRQVVSFSRIMGVIISAFFVALFLIFAPVLLSTFIRESETAALGTVFLRIACLAVPLTTVNFFVSYTLQAMGKGKESLLLSSCRQGIVNIPLLFLMNFIFGMYGIIWTQLLAEISTLAFSFFIYRSTMRKVETIAA